MADTTIKFLSLLLCFVALHSNVTLAQSERWFRVEVVVFSHRGGATAEQWQATPELDYPAGVRFLIEQDRVAANIDRYGGSSSIDSYGRQYITRPGGASAPAVTAPEHAAGPDTSAEETPASNAFVTLPARQLEFGGKASYMQRSGRYDILFHEAWLQPVANEASSRPIVVDRSGDTLQWPRLQGSIKLYLSRYLHLQTNLWLNTSGEYLDSAWRMPAPPLGPASLIVEPPRAMDGLSAVPVPQTEQATAGEAAPDEGQLEPIYPYRHAVLLQQKRRMRSKEVHYIDHPMLGVIIKVTPVGEE